MSVILYLFYILYACFLIKNVPFKRIKLNNISYDITITYKGHFVSFNINEDFLTVLSPNMDEMLEHRVVMKFCV